MDRRARAAAIRAPRLAWWCLLVGLVVLGLPLVAAAQTETGRISGTVIDASGAIVPGATITLKGLGTGVTRDTVSDSNGRYAFVNVNPGPYQLTVELAGFTTANAPVNVTVGSVAEANFKLEVAGTAEAITVTAESAMVNTVNAENATTISETQIRELPTLTRNVYDLVGTAANTINDSSDSGRGTGYSINGQRVASTNVLLDGSANNDEFSASVGQEVPLDSVQEFSVITNNFSAQYGRATGGIVNVATKSGTNVFHGTGYEFYRDDALTTNTYDNKSNNIPKGKFDRSQMGFSMGGPIVRDKIHFFTNLEYIRVRSADTIISWVPTPQFIAASGAATQAFFAKYGGGVSTTGTVLTREQVSAIIGTSSGAFSQLPASLPVFARSEKSLPNDAGGGDPQDQYRWVTRVDWSLNPTNQLYVRYAWQDQQAEPGTNSANPYEGYDTGYINKNHNVLGSYTRVWGSTFTSQSKLVWNRLLSDQPLNGDPLPTLYMNPSGVVRLQGYRITFPGYLPWGPGTAIPFGGPQQLWQFYQDQTWLKGKHEFRFGGNYVHILDDRTFGAYANSVEALNTSSNALVSLDSFVLGQLRRFQTAINPNGYPGGTYTTPVSLPSFNSKNRYNEFALYMNDNWSISNRVTLNLGVRYEYYGPQTKNDPKYDSNFYYPTEDISVNTASPQEMIAALRGGRVYPTNESPIGALWASDWNNWAPRVGFAWDVRGNGKTSVRGGYGMAYERNFGNVTYNVLFNPPEYLVASIDAPADVATMPIFVDNAGPFGGIAGVTKTIPAGSLRHVDQNIQTAYAHFWGLSFQHELGSSNVVLKAEYSGSAGRKLYDLADVNKRGAPLVYLGAGGQLERPTTQYAAFNSRGNRGKSDYHGITLSMESRRVGRTGLQFYGSYTYARAKDNLSSAFSDASTSANNGAFNLGYLDAWDPMLDYGYSEFDVRHRGNISGVWVLPFGDTMTGVARSFVADWQVSFNFSARTGYPFSLFDCTNGFGYCMRAEDPVGIDRNATKGTYTGNPNEFALLDLTPLLPYVGGYVHPVQGTSDFGPYPSDMTERDAFRAPGAWFLDMMLSKRIRFGSRYAVQFRFEAYNVFNHPNLYVYGDQADISSTDTITGYKDGNRLLQLGVKFEF